MVRLTDHPDMTLDVYLGRKTTTQHNLSFATQAIARPGDSREFDFCLCRALVDSLHCGDNFKCLTKSISKEEVQVILTANQNGAAGTIYAKVLYLDPAVLDSSSALGYLGLQTTGAAAILHLVH